MCWLSLLSLSSQKLSYIEIPLPHQIYTPFIYRNLWHIYNKVRVCVHMCVCWILLRAHHSQQWILYKKYRTSVQHMLIFLSMHGANAGNHGWYLHAWGKVCYKHMNHVNIWHGIWFMLKCRNLQIHQATWFCNTFNTCNCCLGTTVPESNLRVILDDDFKYSYLIKGVSRWIFAQCLNHVSHSSY